MGLSNLQISDLLDKLEQNLHLHNTYQLVGTDPLKFCFIPETITLQWTCSQWEQLWHNFTQDSLCFLGLIKRINSLKYSTCWDAQVNNSGQMDTSLPQP
jgi:hypothetical protein